MNTKQFAIATLAGALLCAPSVLLARTPQDQQESVADAARKAQAAKQNAPKAKLSIDNDNLDTIKGSVSVVGQVPASPADQAKAAAAAAADANKGQVKDENYWRKQFADAYKKLTEDSRELDIFQREYNLKEQQYYSDPNTALKQQYSRQDLTDEKTQIDNKTAAVATDKQVISDLEDALRQAGGDPGWATPPSQSPTQAQSETPASAAPPETPAPASGVSAEPSQQPQGPPAQNGTAQQ